MRAEQVKDNNRHLIIHAEGKRSRVHDFELLPKRINIGDFRKPLCVRILFWIGIVNAIHFCRLEDNLRTDLVGAQSRRGIRRKVWITCASSENDYTPFLKMPDGAPANERFGHL